MTDETNEKKKRLEDLEAFKEAKEIIREEKRTEIRTEIRKYRDFETYKLNKLGQWVKRIKVIDIKKEFEEGRVEIR